MRKIFSHAFDGGLPELEKGVNDICEESANSSFGGQIEMVAYFSNEEPFGSSSLFHVLYEFKQEFVGVMFDRYQICKLLVGATGTEN